MRISRGGGGQLGEELREVKVRVLVEQFLEEALAALVGLVPVMALAGIGRLTPLRLRLGRRGGLLRRRGGARLGVALDDLVELAAVEPDSPALRAIVDLDPRSLAHRQGGSVGGAKHHRLLGLCRTPSGIAPRDDKPGAAFRCGGWPAPFDRGRFRVLRRLSASF
jgi:hypothetical protein